MRHEFTFPGQHDGKPFTCHCVVFKGEFSAVNPEGAIGYTTDCPCKNMDSILLEEILRLAERAKDLEAELKRRDAMGDYWYVMDARESRARVVALEEERQVMRDRITTLEQEAAGREELLAALRADLEVATGRYEAEWQRAEGARSERDELAKRVSELEEQLIEIGMENARLVGHVDRLRYAEARLTSLRLEVEVLKLDKRNLGFRVGELEGVRETLLGFNKKLSAEVRNLRTDLASAIRTAVERPQPKTEPASFGGYHRNRVNVLEEENRALNDMVLARQDTIKELEVRLAAAIKTGEEQAEKLHELEAENRRQHGLACAALEESHQQDERLSRLEALLSSEQVPEGFADACNNAFADCVHRITAEAPAMAAWRWLREQLGVKHS